MSENNLQFICTACKKEQEYECDLKIHNDRVCEDCFWNNKEIRAIMDKDPEVEVDAEVEVDSEEEEEERELQIDYMCGGLKEILKCMEGKRRRADDAEYIILCNMIESDKLLYVLQKLILLYPELESGFKKYVERLEDLIQEDDYDYHN